MSKGIVLLADNIEAFVNTRAQFLKRAGYTVLPAYSFQQAREILQTQWIQLAILDIRLIDDHREDDESGLQLAKDPAYQGITKMMLTGFPSLDNIREALSPRTEDEDFRIVRFMSKKEGAEEMVQTVDEIFRDFIHLNLSLQIRWKHPALVSIGHISVLLQDEGAQSGWESQIGELDDVLRMLFYPYEQLTIGRILWHQDQQIALDITLFSEQDTMPAILKISRKTNRESSAIYKNPGFTMSLGESFHKCETLHFRASVWKLDHIIDDAISLGDFIKENSERRISTALESLYQDALRTWYHSDLQLSDQDRRSLYAKLFAMEDRSLEPALIKQRVTRLLQSAMTTKLIHGHKEENHLVTLHLRNGRSVTFHEPALQNTKRPSAKEIVRMVKSPGWISLDTVLINRSGVITLTSVDSAAMVPCERDFVQLEADFHMSAGEPEDILTIYDFEREIASVNDLTSTLPVGNVDQQYRKAMTAIQTVRRLAEESFQISFDSYLFGLWFVSLYRVLHLSPDIKLSSQELRLYLHYLILCGLTAGKLAEKASSSRPVVSGIEMDDEKHEVLLNGHPVTLTPTEYDLLQYLFLKDGNLCRRSEIMKDVFHYQNADVEAEKSLLNTHIGRLKAKIEVDPSNPQYIITVRGQGYRLIKNPGR